MISNELYKDASSDHVAAKQSFINILNGVISTTSNEQLTDIFQNGSDQFALQALWRSTQICNEGRYGEFVDSASKLTYIYTNVLFRYIC